MGATCQRTPVDPGTQQRVPNTLARSARWIRIPQFRTDVAKKCQHEKTRVTKSSRSGNSKLSVVRSRLSVFEGETSRIGRTMTGTPLCGSGFWGLACAD